MPRAAPVTAPPPELSDLPGNPDPGPQLCPGGCAQVPVTDLRFPDDDLGLCFHRLRSALDGRGPLRAQAAEGCTQDARPRAVRGTAVGW